MPRDILFRQCRVIHNAALTGLITLLFFVSPAIAQDPESAPAAEAEQTGSLSEEQAAQLTTLRESLPEQRARITDLEKRVAAESEDLVMNILRARLDMTWVRLLEDNLSLITTAAKFKDQGLNLGEFSSDVDKALANHFDLAKTTLDRISQSVVLPTNDMSPTDRTIAYAQVFAALDTLNRIYDDFSKGITAARSFGKDLSEAETYLKERISDRAVNTSVFLEMALRDITALRAAAAIAPEEASIKVSLTEAESRLQSAAKELERIANRMDQYDLDTTEYRAQILQATGEISADIFNLDVIMGLISKWWGRTTDVLIEEGPGFLFQVLLFLLIVYIARKFALIAEKLVKRALSPSRVRISRLLENMIVSTAGNVVLVIGILVGLSQLGISLGPLLAGLGIAGFIIGFALQDTLSNFASGLMILFYRPYDVGDFIESNGVRGEVSHMSLVNTTILTIDNQTIVLPNNMVWQNMIMNITGQELRRVDLMFGVSYSDDIPKVENILADVVASQEQVLEEPKPMIRLHELGDSSVNFVVRPWVKTEDYWDVYWDLMRKVKIRFDEEGISIPFPQRDVHHYYETAPVPPGS